MKIAKKILIIAAALIIGFIIGWRVTVCNGNISRKTNARTQK
jgi:hypothetical protein